MIQQNTAAKVIARQKLWRRIVVALLFIQSTTVVALGWLVVRKVHQAVEQRCAVALRGQCTIGNMSLQRNGVVLTNVQAKQLGGGIVSRMDVMQLEFSWVKLLSGTRQGLGLYVQGVHLSANAPLESIQAELARMSARRPEGPTYRRVRLDRFSLGSMDVQTNVGHGVYGGADGFTARWTRGDAVRAHANSIRLTAAIVPILSVHNCDIELDFIRDTSDIRCSDHVRRVPIPHQRGRVDYRRLAVGLFGLEQADRLRRRSFFSF